MDEKRLARTVWSSSRSRYVVVLATAIRDTSTLLYSRVPRLGNDPCHVGVEHGAPLILPNLMSASISIGGFGPHLTGAFFS